MRVSDRLEYGIVGVKRSAAQHGSGSVRRHQNRAVSGARAGTGGWREYLYVKLHLNGIRAVRHVKLRRSSHT